MGILCTREVVEAGDGVQVHPVEEEEGEEGGLRKAGVEVVVDTREEGVEG